MTKSKLVDETTDTTEETTAEPKQYKTEAAARIAQSQIGVTKKRVHVRDHKGTTFSTLCDALVAHSLDKVKDWPAARNALKKEGTYTRTVEPKEGDAYELTLETIDDATNTVESADTTDTTEAA